MVRMRLCIVIIAILAFLNTSRGYAQGLVGEEPSLRLACDDPVYPPALSSLILQLIRAGVQIPDELLSDNSFKNWLGDPLVKTKDLYLKTLVAVWYVRAHRLLLNMSDEPRLDSSNLYAFMTARSYFESSLVALSRQNPNKFTEFIEIIEKDPAFIQGQISIRSNRRFEIAVLGDGLGTWTYLEFNRNGRSPILLYNSHNLPTAFSEIYKHKPIAIGKARVKYAPPIVNSTSKLIYLPPS